MLSAAVAVGVAFEASATSMLAVEVPELTHTSDVVLRGKVKKKEARWSSDGMRIFTEVELTIDEALKGQKPTTPVYVYQPGGTVGDLAQKVSGLASFEEGEEVVVFLTRRGGKGAFQVTGLGQGKFRVERSSDGKAAFVVPERLDDALVLDPTTRQPVRRRSDPFELETLRREVKAAQAAGKSGKRTR